MIDIIYSFVIYNALDIVTIAVILLIGVIAYKRGQREFVMCMVLTFVTEAEKKFGSGTGELKYAIVTERLYEAMPKLLKLVYTKQQLDKMIEEAVNYLKQYLSEGRDLLGYDEEKKKAVS
ncbi:hypothetical protein SAMN05446037_10497 [Anaerovirgula multivorans]|uniref:Bacteriophage holin of superfamily 6 (Holin_LLH) n=1 Tax=Anaerovirgula multivorans TaxID=312168 RepID=A0A239KK00_9FIRM|nr:hypothetical protein [Anaerovirgula multivorans]SNT18481.1 hypothetical protein SAMN05446037_10497 [Anaerovirgula multivorans]